MTEAWEAPESGAEESKLSPPPELFAPPKPRRWRWIFFIVVGVGVAFAAGAWAGYQRLWTPTPLPAAGVRIILHEGRLYALWNSKSPKLSGHRSARLEIRDRDGTRWMDLDAAAVAHGSELVQSDGRDLKVRLHGSGWAESARYAGPPPLPGIEGEAASDSDPGMGAVRAQVDEQLARNQELDDELQSLRSQLSDRLKPAADRDNQSRADTARNVAVPAPPPSRLDPQTAGPRFGAAISSQLSPRRVDPAPVTASPPATQLNYSGPLSGRIVWAGMLEPNATLHIRNGKASAGNITGSLPGVAVRLRVMPAINSADGLLVYSNNARHRTPEVSPPGPDTAFRRMTFRYDAGRSQRAQVVSSPSAQSGWTELSIRAVSVAVTALVIEWEVLR